MKALIFQILAIFSFLAASCPHTAIASELCLANTKVQFAKATQLKNEGQYLLSSQQYSLIEALACNDHEKAKAQVGYAQTLYHLGEKMAAEKSLQALVDSKTSEPEIRNAELLRAFYQPEFRRNLPPTDQQRFSAFDSQRREIEVNLRPKKPWLAGSLSAVIPGLGQVYNGNLQSAAIALVLNGAFLATALELNKHNLKASALAAGLVLSVTYAGNILGSIESAKQINAHDQEPEIDRLRRERLPEVEL